MSSRGGTCWCGACWESAEATERDDGERAEVAARASGEGTACRTSGRSNDLIWREPRPVSGAWVSAGAIVQYISDGYAWIGIRTGFDLPADAVVVKVHGAGGARGGGDDDAEGVVAVAEVGERGARGGGPECSRVFGEDVRLEHAAFADALLDAAHGDDERFGGHGFAVIAHDRPDDCMNPNIVLDMAGLWTKMRVTNDGVVEGGGNNDNIATHGLRRGRG